MKSIRILNLVIIIFLSNCAEKKQIESKIEFLRSKKEKACYSVPFVYYYLNYLEMPPDIPTAVKFYQSLFPLDSIVLEDYYDPYSKNSELVQYVFFNDEKDSLNTTFIITSDGPDLVRNTYSEVIDSTMFYNQISTDKKLALELHLNIKEDIKSIPRKDILLERISPLTHYINSPRKIFNIENFVTEIKDYIPSTINIIAIESSTDELNNITDIKIDKTNIKFNYAYLDSSKLVQDTVVIIGKLSSLSPNEIVLENCILK
jgi:hypothetical protein